MNKDSLKSYREKRDFDRTPEPEGTPARAHKDPIFVIQQHDARAHHYDLRLQIGDVLKSWAVPKGPSTDTSEKRLAIATEDHPLEYADFEGIIPEGEYGAGKVIVWDTGTYRNMTTKAGKDIPAQQAVEHGHLRVWLQGHKLRGGFALNRIRKGPQEQWLLVKVKDEEANPEHPPEDLPESVLSGRKIEDVGVDTARVDRAITLAKKLSGSKQRTAGPIPSHIEPMYAQMSKMPSKMQGYAFEYKWDGIRVICYWDGKQIRLESRNQLDITFRWPELMKIGDELGSATAILDGEIVALDAKNRVNFGLLSRRMHLSSRPTAAQRNAVSIVYMIFDILYLSDKSLIDLPYKDRRSILMALRPSGANWQTPEAVSEDPEVILAAAIENGMEGLVAKRLGSKYRPGNRTRDWLKIKAINKQEFVIGGWVPLKGNVARGVGALLVGHYDDGDLIFAGKVGTGYSDAMRTDLKRRLQEIIRKTSPFQTRIPHKDIIFVEPELVAEVEFREWTDDGILRHSSFKGLRMDKGAREVVRETPR